MRPNILWWLHIFVLFVCGLSQRITLPTRSSSSEMSLRPRFVATKRKKRQRNWYYMSAGASVPPSRPPSPVGDPVRRPLIALAAPPTLHGHRTGYINYQTEVRKSFKTRGRHCVSQGLFFSGPRIEAGTHLEAGIPP